MDRICIIIPVHNRKPTTLKCLGHLQKISHQGFEYTILVVDDGSSDGTSEAIELYYPDVVINKGSGNLWWAGGVNLGLKYVLEKDFDFAYIINDDIKINTNTLQLLYDAAKENPSTVVTSTRILETDGTLYAGFIQKGIFKKLIRQRVNEEMKASKFVLTEVDTVNTQSTLIPKDIIKQVGLFDAKRFPHNYSDFDYFISVKEAGFRLLVHLKSYIEAGHSDSKYHHLILNNDIQTIYKSFFNIKYANHLGTVYNRSMKRRNMVFGSVAFIYSLLPYLFGLALKIALPKSQLKKIFKAANKI